jgi:DNA-binding NarL/FixJ family response regulator
MDCERWKKAAIMNSSARVVLGQAKTVGSALFSSDAWQQIARLLHLSERELQVVQAVFDDVKDRRIATHIGISQHTVHTHFERLYQKLEVHNRTSLMLRIFAAYLSVSDDSHGRL